MAYIPLQKRTILKYLVEIILALEMALFITDYITVYETIIKDINNLIEVLKTIDSKDFKCLIQTWLLLTIFLKIILNDGG